MKIRAIAVALLWASATAGCASAGPATAPAHLPSPDLVRGGDEVPFELLSPAARLVRGARAVQTGDLPRGASLLERVWSECGDTPAGRRALLLLSAARLDPGGAGGDPDAAARDAARYLALPGRDAWGQALARQLYLLSLELGARPVRAKDLRTDHRPSPASLLPAGELSPGACALPSEGTDGRPPATALPRLTGAPVSRRLARLESRVAALQKELDRIRKTIH